MDIFSTDTLLAIVRDLRVVNTGILSRYFPNTQQDTSEEIHFDLENKPRRMAPFVSPLVAGKIVKSRGFQTATFKPAYIKDKRIFTPNRAVKRAMGERIGGGDFTPQQRMQILLVNDMQDQLDMLNRRFEWMATTALLDGKITIESDEYPSTLVDFGRNAAHSVTKSAGQKWSDTGAAPLDDLQTWSDTMLQNTGVGIIDVIMSVDVWKVFRKAADVKTHLDRPRDNSSLLPDAQQQEGLTFKGNIEGFNIFVYSGWVDGVDGLPVASFPAGTVLCTGGAALEGVRHFGAVLDHDSLLPETYFVKSWLEEDPSVRFLLMQSAPLMVPYRPNASFKAKVL